MMRIPTLLATAVLAAACASAPKEPPPKPFLGTRWQVVLDLPLAGEQPSLRFGDGRVEGFGGCNDVTARYLQDSVGSRFIAIRRLEVGRRNCDAAARAAEQSVLAVLQDVSSYTITGDRMLMSGSSGSLRLVAMPAGMAPLAGNAAATSIAGTRWAGAASGSDGHGTPRLEFAAGGKLTGYTGCNMLTGEWREEGGRVAVSSLAATKRMCVGAEGEVEKRFLAALGEASRFEVQAGKLVITAPSGARFELSAADAA